MADLAVHLGDVSATQAMDRGLPTMELIRSLTEALRRVEGRQAETESRVERLERDLGRGRGSLGLKPYRGSSK